jgi:hypothetical protein
VGEVLISVLKFVKRRKGNTAFGGVVSVISNRCTIVFSVPEYKESLCTVHRNPSPLWPALLRC